MRIKWWCNAPAPGLRPLAVLCRGPSSISVEAFEVETLCKEGCLDRAMDSLLYMDEQGSVPSVSMYRNLLHACMKQRALPEAKKVQAHLAKHGLEWNRSLSELVVTTLVNCGSIEEGLSVFQKLSTRTVFSWTAIISGYVKAGRCQEALSCYEQMQEEGVQPDRFTFVTLLKACSLVEDLEKGRWIHAHARECGLELDTFVGTSLVSMYAKCGSVVDAQGVFDRVRNRNVVSWNAMLAAYVQQNEGESALQVYGKMQLENVSPNARTFASALRACIICAEKETSSIVNGQVLRLQYLQKGKEIHAQAASGGFDSDVFVGSILVTMYAKCGSLLDAQQVFDQLPHRSVVSWNAMLAACAQQNQVKQGLQIYARMQAEGIGPNARTVVSALQMCGILAGEEDAAVIEGQNLKLTSLQKGKEIHAEAAVRRFCSDVFVGNTLVSMYAKCGSMIDAHLVFDSLTARDVVSWNAMLSAYAHEEQGEKALQIYEQMQEEGVKPTSRTLVGALQACESTLAREETALVHGQQLKVKLLHRVKEIHAEAVSRVFETDAFVSSSLVSMYAKCGSFGDARDVFHTLSHRDVVSWTAMLAAHVQQGQAEEALHLYYEMQVEGIDPNIWTLISILQACGSLAENEEGSLQDAPFIKAETLHKAKDIHATTVQLGYGSDMLVCNCLVTIYARCGSLKDAQRVFDELSMREVASWNAMITAYSQHGRGDRVWELYAQMCSEGVKADETTFVVLLEACSCTGALDVCIHIHQEVARSEFNTSLSVANTLVHAYGKCGSMVDAQNVFDSLHQPDVVSWTALLSGYARHGDCRRSMQCFKDMCLAGVTPDKITFMALLSACSNAGLVNEGLEYFEAMSRDHKISAEVEHYVCVIDLVARAGLFRKAEDLLSSMPMQPTLPVWLCLLGACQKHGNVVLARRAFDCAMCIDTEQAAPYVLMANIYQNAGMWDQAREVHELRQRAGAWKKPGQSWIKHEQQLHTFLVRGQGQDEVLLTGLLEALRLELKDAGYASTSDSTQSDIPEKAGELSVTENWSK